MSSTRLRKRQRMSDPESSSDSGSDAEYQHVLGYRKDSFVASEDEESSDDDSASEADTEELDDDSVSEADTEELDHDSVSEVDTEELDEDDSVSEADLEVPEKLEEVGESQELSKIIGILRRDEPSFTKVLTGPFTVEEKADLVQEMVVYSNLESGTQEKYQLRKKLVTRLQGGDPEVMQRINSLVCSDADRAFITTLYKSNIAKLDNAELTAWLNAVLELPWKKEFQSRLDLSNIGACYTALKTRLDQKVYGLEKVKEQLLQFFFNRLLNPTKPNNTFLTLVGPPGVGKTTILQCISEVFGIPMEHISMASITHKDALKGSLNVWVGSSKGLISNALKTAGVCNPILFFDEIDKVSQGVHQSFLEIADPLSNRNFRDSFIPEIPIDLSQSWIVFACNNIEDVDPVLRDRLHCITIPNYTNKDKVSILTNHLLPSISMDHGLSATDITVSPALAEKWVNCMGKGSNIRPLATEVTSIVQKIKLVLALGEQSHVVSYNLSKISLPVVLSEKQLETLREKELRQPETQLSMYA